MPEDNVDFWDPQTTLAAIKGAGWKHWGGAGGWYGFERTVDGSRERVSVPHWIRQMVLDASHDGARTDIRAALGIEETEEE